MTSYTNGAELTVHIRNALAMSKRELGQLEALVLKGGEVEASGLRGRIEQTFFLGFVCHEFRMVAVGAIKRPTPHHILDLAGKSGFNLDAYRGELGYLYVEPDYRGRRLCSRIADGLLDAYSDRVFATTRSDNTAIHRILLKSSFVRCGSDWKSQMRPNVNLWLWAWNPQS